MKNFNKVLNDVEKTFNKNLKEKGESWKTLPLDFLENKLKEEYGEYDFNRGKHPKLVYEELLDVILVSLMLAERIKIKNKR